MPDARRRGHPYGVHGKEVIATFIHLLSARRGELIEVNAATLNDQLLERELFGHEKGAFTGASHLQRGKLELASGGTLFLDEIGDMPPRCQAKILKAVEEAEIWRVGGRRAISVDVRLIAATNADLTRARQEGRFRDGLYHRFPLKITIPPLCHRPEDIAPLARMFLAKFCREHARSLALSPEALMRLSVYQWPGNVRELRNVLERTVLLHEDDGEIGPAELNMEGEENAHEFKTLYNPDLTFKTMMERAKRWLLHEGLTHHAGSRRRTAKQFGMPESTLYAKLKKHGLTSIISHGG